MSFLPDNLREKIRKLNGDIYLVGGAVRDDLLGKETNDYDFEIFNVEPSEFVTNVINLFPDAKITGNDFSVITEKWRGYELQFSIPRTERKNGQGYKGFEVFADPFMSVQDAAKRRDLTINSLYVNIRTNTLDDSTGGVSDIRTRTLRPVSERFCEDPVRILRVAYFASRDSRWHIDGQLYQYAAKLLPELPFITKEKIYEVLNKMAAKSVVPSNGLNFLLDTNWLSFMDDISGLQYVPQNPKYHPEGNVWNHTMQVMDFAMRQDFTEYIGVIPDEQIISEKIDLFYAALLHDIGKLWTTKINPKDNQLHAYGHEQKSADNAERILKSINPNFDKRRIKRVQELCKYHMYLRYPASRKLARKLRFALKATDLYVLHSLCTADQLSRISSEGIYPETFEKDVENLDHWMLEFLNLPEEKPIISGDDLITCGLKPGPHFKRLLAIAIGWQCKDILTADNKQNRLKELCNIKENSK